MISLITCLRRMKISDLGDGETLTRVRDFKIDVVFEKKFKCR